MIEIIEDRYNWNKQIEACKVADFYHTYEYHKLDKKEGEKAILIKYTEGKLAVLLPLLLRRIEGTTYLDATSVYGYSGPLVTNYTRDTDLKAYHGELNKYFDELKLVSVFSRLNPFIPHQEIILKGMGAILSPGEIVNIDLTRSANEQLKAYRRRLRTYINSLRKAYTIDETPSTERIEQFIDIYHKNMHRVGANSRYFFDRDYFYNLMTSSSFEATLMAAENKNTRTMAAGSLFIKKNNIVQYHLSGVKEDHLKLNPVKLLIDEMRLRATAEGFHFFNLGGGVGNRKDSLFEFKKGFSDDIKPFKVWRYTVNADVYARLVKEKHEGGCRHQPVGCLNFFPCYRCETS